MTGIKRQYSRSAMHNKGYKGTRDPNIYRSFTIRLPIDSYKKLVKKAQQESRSVAGQVEVELKKTGLI